MVVNQVVFFHFPGSTDMDMPPSLLHSIQNQMQSKGGYEAAYGVKIRVKGAVFKILSDAKADLVHRQVNFKRDFESGESTLASSFTDLWTNATSYFFSILSYYDTDEADIRLDGKVAIVTGSNTGIGFETAKELAKRGARVILACRDEAKAILACNNIRNETGNSDVFYKPLDLASFKSVHAFSNDILANEPKLNILINNAGTGKLDNSLTEDNLPIEMQVNYFSPFLLTNLLLPLLKKSTPSRIINISSVMHYFGTVDLKAINKPARNWFQHSRVYSNSKLCNILFTKELSCRLEESGITTNCLHPGAVSSDIFRNQNAINRFLIRMLFKSSWQGAQTTLYLALSPEVACITGKYFSDCKESKTSKLAQDLHLARKLWETTEHIVRLK
ncbi:hypothetical protein EVAR_789_1 [Eumeta japonica]|uniref:Retinol dehydrogenase 12 n=1 Tax=Eumeta variegata TaxID=151549 RepID=A0A4C1SBZ4_EUMVA|nr:hypothetical protein EVAR_789_1 [Eumeta japonica]